ncbi:MAG: 1,4-dihydroxy-2-naphthoate polyprenyltransferase [Actinomycetota bacterium]|jgi:1,4-dihydroxy-2-naphthoate octaprenyltransferase|nr:1,4-dihydroxy-2-naphthoate polyprenyltransferase [Actinomycetota bacterium]
MSNAAAFVAGARPRTLPIAVVPVLVGTAVAGAQGHVIWWRSVAALVVSLALQVGVNYANDYSDGVRGTDAERVGPVRLVAGGLASPGAVRLAAWLSFGVAGLAGLALAIATSPWLLVVGAVSVAAAWFYTGGPRPYGYAGLGEAFVFVFFGLVAVVGSAYVSLERVTGLAVLAAVPVGLLSVAVLVVNNLRDIPTDALSGKRTLAVRIGDGRTRWMYVACLVGSFVVVAILGTKRPLALIALAAAALALSPARSVLKGASGRHLVPVLVMTGRLLLAFGVLLAAGIAW